MRKVIVNKVLVLNLIDTKQITALYTTLAKITVSLLFLKFLFGKMWKYEKRWYIRIEQCALLAAFPK